MNFKRIFQIFARYLTYLSYLPFTVISQITIIHWKKTKGSSSWQRRNMNLFYTTVKHESDMCYLWEPKRLSFSRMDMNQEATVFKTLYGKQGWLNKTQIFQGLFSPLNKEWIVNFDKSCHVALYRMTFNLYLEVSSFCIYMFSLSHSLHFYNRYSLIDTFVYTCIVHQRNFQQLNLIEFQLNI